MSVLLPLHETIRQAESDKINEPFVLDSLIGNQKKCRVHLQMDGVYRRVYRGSLPPSLEFLVRRIFIYVFSSPYTHCNQKASTVLDTRSATCPSVPLSLELYRAAEGNGETRVRRDNKRGLVNFA